MPGKQGFAVFGIDKGSKKRRRSSNDNSENKREKISGSDSSIEDN